MEKIQGEFGVVSGIRCPVGVPTVIVEDGELSGSINKNQHFNYGYPENCPRIIIEGRFDFSQPVGCIRCPKSILEFVGAHISLDNRTGEVLPL